MRWLLTGRDAQLVGDVAHATLDLNCPDQGIHSWSLRGQGLPEVCVLAVDIAGAPADAYVRQGDLIATYEPTVDRPTRVEICWRLPPEGAGADLPWVELQVSVQTSLLDSHPQIDCYSRFSSGEFWRLSKHQQFTRTELPTAGVRRTSRDDHSCTLVRELTSAPRVSYCEMAYPADFRIDCLRPISGGLELRHELFPEYLEKGVILRSRLRSAWLPALGDQDVARARHQEFCDSPLPLTA